MKPTPFAAAIRSLLIPAALVPLAACAMSSRAPLEKLDARATFPVTYTGSLTTDPPELASIDDETGGNENDDAPVLRPMAKPAAATDGTSTQVDVRLVEIARRSVHSDLGLPEQGVTAIVLDSAPLNRAMKRLHDEKKAHELSSPHLLTRDGERACVATATQLSYVGAFELQGNETSVTADPDVRTAAEGTLVSVLPRLSSDRTAVDVDLSMQVNILLRPIPEARARIFAGPPVAVQLPAFLEQHLETTVRLTNGTTILINGLSTDDPETLLLVLVTVKVNDPERGGGRVVGVW